MGEPETQARFFYLAILLLAIGGSFLYANRHRMGQTLQQAAVWAAIFVVAILGYGFKDELTRQLYPRAAVSTADGGIELHRGRDGHFAAQLEVNGVPVDFLVDTGASDIVLSEEDARRIGINMAALEFTGIASTANGRVKTARVRLDTVSFAGRTDHDVGATVNGGPLAGSLLGMSYLNRFARIEIEGNRMILHP